MNYYLAVDIGASSGRHMLGHIENGKIVMEEIYRFKTHDEQKQSKWYWDSDALVENVIKGMEACKATGKIPCMMGINSWGMDYVLLDKKGSLLGNAADYRDEMGMLTMMSEVEKVIPYTELYDRTGISRMPGDTIYQLMTIKTNHPDVWEQVGTVLMIPSFINYRLTGIIKEEYTNATTTGLINLKTKTWDEELIERVGLPKNIFIKLHKPGEIVGKISDNVRNRVGFDCPIVLPISHDTASAYMAVPTKDDGVYISSGTWSLLGMMSDNPINTPEAMKAEFTNEGAYAGRYRVIRGILGMFILDGIKSDLGNKHDYTQLTQMAMEAEDISSVINVRSIWYLIAPNMIEAIKGECSQTGQRVPETDGQVLKIFFNSLVKAYAESIIELKAVTGKKITAIHIVGGGSQNNYLNMLTAQKTGLPVLAGPAEATVIGNLLSQMIAGGELIGIDAAKAVCAETFPVKHFS